MNSPSFTYATNPTGVATYKRNCNASDVAYHLIYEGKCLPLDTAPQLIPVNFGRLGGSPALAGHYMAD